MDRNCAEQIKSCALQAIESLSRALAETGRKMPELEYAKLKKCVGLSIGRIQTDMLEMVYSQYPDMDDLK